ncbi:hypothetical protein INT47_010269 [Mucor saturninus]|uniref:Uncharacterized protein n=1 Tax=Mucor saturninus TaxID=64648 RepID=A0A8H7QJW0_9FUNG|nr:hypothetical protein INT47_010269 [Mucor saturninus]
MPNNSTTHSNLDHAPAQMVGGMRVKQAAHRTSHANDKKEDATSNKEDNEKKDEEEKERIRQYDLHAHTASRQPDVSKNAGSNVKQHIHPVQPRSVNH